MFTFDVDLDKPPTERWDGIEKYADAAHELLDYYVRDLGGLDQFGDMLLAYRDGFVAADHAEEMRSLASLLGRSEPEVLLSNLYYDAIKHLFACTAFAVDSPLGPLHARNLDWGTVNAMLSKHTMVTSFRRGGHLRFKTVGWPGYAGALSGIAPGRFSITLNAVLSDDPPALAPPITFLIREVLEHAADYDGAVKRLASQDVTSDSLLLVSGVEPGQMVVIERSPTRSEIRTAENGFVHVTNDYKRLTASESGAVVSALAESSCRRFDRAAKMVELMIRKDAETVPACFDVLADPHVKMLITVQSMVFRAADGTIEVRLPTSAD